MMIERRAVLALGAAFGAALLLPGCGLLDDRASYRFRMTAEADTPQGPRSGSSVYEVHAANHNGPRMSEEKAGSTAAVGDALVIDLPSGPVFILLKMPVSGDNLSTKATDALLPDHAGGDLDQYIADLRMLGASGEGEYRGDLPRAAWPVMVRFRDLKDPTSVEAVDPETVGIKRIWVETTQAEMTRGIEKRLPSFQSETGFDKWYGSLAMDDPRRVTLDDFSNGHW